MQKNNLMGSIQVPNSKKKANPQGLAYYSQKNILPN